MSITSRKRKTAFLVTIVLVTGNLLLANWIGLGRYGRIDLTRDGMFTLAPATRELLANLDDLVVARVFLSDKAFKENASYASLPRLVHDRVDEFAAQSKGRMRVEYLDPSNDPKIETEARQAGVQQLQLSAAGSGSLSIFTPFCGMTLAYGGKEEVIPVADPERLEYDVALALTRLTRRSVITIGIDSLHDLPEGLPPDVLAQLGDKLPKDEHTIDGDLKFIVTEMRKQFAVEKVPLSSPVPEHIALLIMANLKGMTDVNRFHLDQYIMGGGKVMFLASGTEMNPQIGPVARDGSNDAFFENYGFSVQKNLVLDLQAPLTQQGYAYYFPQMVSRYFDPESPLMSGIDSFLMPFASSITLDPKPGVEAVALVRSSPQAWEQQGFFNLDPRTILSTAGDKKKFDLVGMLHGTFTSYFTNRPLPEGLNGLPTGPSAKDLGLSPEDLEHADDDSADDEGDEADDGEAGDTTDGASGDEANGGGARGDGGSAGAQETPAAPEPAPAEPLAQDEQPAQTEPPAQAEPAGQDASAPAQQPPAAPADSGASQEPGAAPKPGEPAVKPATFVKSKSPETTLIVIGSDTLITNSFAQRAPGNLEFFLTLCDRLTTGSKLSELRNRFNDSVAVSADYSEAEKAAIKYAGMLGMPLLVLIAGVSVFLVRKARRSLAS